MQRLLGVLGAAILTIVGVGLAFAPAASAQTGGGVGVVLTCPVSSYPPVTTTDQRTVSVTSAVFHPGGSGHLGIAGVTPNHSYVGTIFSAPIPIGPSMSDANGNVAFDFSVPSDFAVDAFHTATLTCGNNAFSLQFCVGSTGQLSPDSACTTQVAGEQITNNGTGTTSGSSLARTGIDHVWDLVRIAAALIAVGALFLHAKHRREAAER